MNIDELISKLKTIEEDTNGDTENTHIGADDLLLEYINNEEVTKLFNDLEKWYA